jgi:hypothetical protein
MGGYFTHGSPQKKSCATSKCNIYTEYVEYSDRLPVKHNRAHFQSRNRLGLPVGCNNISASPTTKTTLHKGCVPR